MQIFDSDEKTELCMNSTSNCNSSTQFECRNKACVTSEAICNGIRDCSDNSDESGCGVNECASPVLNRCSHICRDTLTSFVCSCRTGYKLVDRYTCVDLNECRETPWVCSQLCENRPGGYSCKCAQGYEKAGDSSQSIRLCKLSGPRIEANLLFTNDYYLRNISLESNNYNLVKSGFHAARGIAYDFNQSSVYVLDAETSQLIRLQINESNVNSEVFLEIQKKFNQKINYSNLLLFKRY